MDARGMAAANDGINHETGYGHEHEKRNSQESHYIPPPPAYEIRRGQLDGTAFSRSNLLKGSYVAYFACL